MTAIQIGVTATGHTVSLPLRFANRHGLVTGSTGTGKTVTLQRLVEQLSAAGVPVFAADIKGDLSGIAAPGDPEGKLAAASARLGRAFTPDKFPVRFWDLFGETGSPIRTTVHEMGAELLSRMLGLNETQQGVLAIAFRHAKDGGDRIMDLGELRAHLQDMVDYRDEVSQKYGHLTTSAINVIQRRLFALEAQGGGLLFGDPVLDIRDMIAHADDGRGIVNLIDADKLMEAPKLYATFLLWLLTELFRVLPEAGDLAKPIFAFFFDEAHLLFSDAPKSLLDMIERLVRLVRSKGVGVYFVTQSPKDIPDAVLAQLGNRIQHALRAYTAADQRMVAASARAFRAPPKVRPQGFQKTMESAITELAIGEAFVSVLTDDGVPSHVERIRVLPPSGHVGPITDVERRSLIEADPIAGKYVITDHSQRGCTGRWREFMRRILKDEGLPYEHFPTANDPYPDWIDAPASNPLDIYAEASAAPAQSLRQVLCQLARDMVGLVFWGFIVWQVGGWWWRNQNWF